MKLNNIISKLSDYFNVDGNKSLIVRGSDEVKNIYFAPFLTHDIVKKYIEQSNQKDLLFTHLIEENRLSDDIITKLIHQKRSIYVQNALLYFVKALNGEIIDFKPTCVTCNINSTMTNKLIFILLEKLHVPSIDSNVYREDIKNITISFSDCDMINTLKKAEQSGVSSFIIIDCHHLDQNKTIQDFIENTEMNVLTISSQVMKKIVLKYLATDLFKDQFNLSVTTISLDT